MTTDILALTDEAALLLRQGKIFFANASAKGLFGADCVGKSAQALLGGDISGTQANSFIAGIKLGGVSRIARVSRVDVGTVVFISRIETTPEALNEPFLYALRSGLMNVGLSADMLRQWAEEHGQNDLLPAIAGLTRSQYALARAAQNASMLLNSDENSLDEEKYLLNITAMFSELLDAVSHFVSGVELHVNLGRDISAPVAPALMRRLLLNLISNSLTHAKGLDQINVRLSETAGSVILSVSDNGCGIEPDKLPTVFDRYRHEFTLRDMGSGAGIGLSVCRKTAELHGGTLLLESRPGFGTTVRVSIGKTSSHISMRSPSPSPGSLSREVLVGLANCLPQECYGEKYMD